MLKILSSTWSIPSLRWPKSESNKWTQWSSFPPEDHLPKPDRPTNRRSKQTATSVNQTSKILCLPRLGKTSSPSHPNGILSPTTFLTSSNSINNKLNNIRNMSNVMKRDLLWTITRDIKINHSQLLETSLYHMKKVLTLCNTRALILLYRKEIWSIRVLNLVKSWCKVSRSSSIRWSKPLMKAFMNLKTLKYILLCQARTRWPCSRQCNQRTLIES